MWLAQCHKGHDDAGPVPSYVVVNLLLGCEDAGL